MIIIDTDIMIDIFRQYQPALTWLESIEEDEIILPGFVVMELIQGCKNKTEQQKLENTLFGYAVTWPSTQTCDKALSLFARFHLSHGIGFLDALIGQMTVSLNSPLYTFNQKHYSIIPFLKTVPPYDKE